MKIGELSERTGVSIPTIRVYEREGLISLADRTEGRFRIFTEDQRIRLEFIKTLRDLGFPLSDVKSLILLSEGLISEISPDKLGAIASDVRSKISKLERLLAGLLLQKETNKFEQLKQVFENMTP